MIIQKGENNCNVWSFHCNECHVCSLIGIERRQLYKKKLTERSPREFIPGFTWWHGYLC